MSPKKTILASATGAKLNSNVFTGAGATAKFRSMTWWPEGARLSATHTLAGGHRAFDTLHVAHARLAKPRQFLSFDANQLRLAKAVGLRCGA